ncbi:LysR family transcriptional regulator [Silvibacterium acidisoli]|uniref:LysR family transcriptional regulator n=1 Tax=Acidobacteriaceae bacterium ZG23-2 TaxID=2883246 RepID=UPI00406D48B1
MDIDDLRVVTAVVKHGSMNLAAAELHMVHSNVTAMTRRREWFASAVDKHTTQARRGRALVDRRRSRYRHRRDGYKKAAQLSALQRSR